MSLRHLAYRVWLSALFVFTTISGMAVAEANSSAAWHGRQNDGQNPPAYNTAMSEYDAALRADNKVLAARKYAEAANTVPSRCNVALAAAQMLADTRQYVDAASLAARVKDTTASDSERKTAVQLLEKLQPHYQKTADLEFVDTLRQTMAGNLKSALPAIDRVRRLVFDPQEGLLTYAFVQFGAGNSEGAQSTLKQWIDSGKRSPYEIGSIRLATYYDPYVVLEALANDEIHEMMVKAYGKYAATRLNRIVEDSRQAEEPTVKTINPKDGAKMLLIPEGKFLMGDRGAPNNPRRTVQLSGYWIYEKLVTVNMYRKYCTETGKKMPSEPNFSGYHFNPAWKKGDHPIVNVSWPEAVAYCNWAGVRLPTEAEWEKAARGTDGRRYPWGNAWNPSLLHHSNDDGDAKGTAPAGSFPGGASPYGGLDMAGMVFQWCSDYYLADYWRYAPQKDPTGPSTGKDKVVKSGSWYDDDDVDFVVGRRTGYDPKLEYIFAGFRCASKF